MLKDGEVSAIPSIRQKVSVKNIFDNDFMNREERRAYVCLPLFTNEILYGILLCDLTEGVFANGEFLLNHMSSAAKMILLLQTNEQMQQKLEENKEILQNWLRKEKQMLSQRELFLSGTRIRSRCFR